MGGAFCKIKERLAREIKEGGNSSNQSTYSVYNTANVNLTGVSPSETSGGKKQQETGLPATASRDEKEIADRVEQLVAQELARYHERLEIERAKDEERYAHQYSTEEIRQSLRDMIQQYSDQAKYVVFYSSGGEGMMPHRPRG
ncbi:hypothetical protein EV182_003448 [Spiromyces aspiralis]|uniref:Uncharacterized protein n=1 Tax=Spiromyces aspiralis TaxID=68401 RepID=A0ACC1HFE4_9FUNG|nr:hypothetical protein EV182_003448 [Spiromyces aspiralis]